MVRVAPCKLSQQRFFFLPVHPADDLARFANQALLVEGVHGLLNDRRIGVHEVSDAGDAERG
ncbi:MAG TPA: hypothetical protein PKD73_12095 [Burkholderiaceae bacterium]|nr:hypothetical protein [Burkholderiaceae bacterium]